MKTALVGLLSIVLVGCGLELLGGAAIESGLQAKQLQTLKGQLDHAKNTTSTLSAQQAVNAYRATKGENPPSLEALVPEWMPSVPLAADGTPLSYDPATGTVSDRPVQAVARPAPSPRANPAAQAAQEADQRKIEEIRRAINQFGQATGYYPGSLDQLAPFYLAEPPRTSAGQEFLYDPQTGAVGLPPQNGLAQAAPMYQQAQQGPRAPVQPSAGGAGVGPMGEVMTGIGIQNELNRMSSAGSSAASSRMRQNARNAGQDHDQRNQQVMNELGQ